MPVHVADNLTPAQVKAYRLMDNHPAIRETDWDLGLLGPELEELRELDFNLRCDRFRWARESTTSFPIPVTTTAPMPCRRYRRIQSQGLATCGCWGSIGSCVATARRPKLSRSCSAP